MAASRIPTTEQPGSPCGSTWNRSITVTGELPGGLGRDFKYTIAPAITSVPQETGYDSSAEKEARTALARRMSSIRWTIAARAKLLSKNQLAFVNRTLNRAADALNRIEAIYRYWRHERPGDSYPLPAADFPEGFDMWCVGAPPGMQFPAGKDPRWSTNRRCPTRNEMDVQRPRDRVRIAELLREAATQQRCAEWALWRYTLYAEARRANPPTRVPTGGAQRPTGPGGIVVEVPDPGRPRPDPRPLPPGAGPIPIPIPIPDEPDDAPAPPGTDPGSPAPVPGETGELPPDSGGEPPPAPQPSSGGSVGMVLGGAAVVGALAWAFSR